MTGAIAGAPLGATSEGTRTLASGDVLFRQGDAVAKLYMLQSGAVRLVRHTVDGTLVVIHTARPGETIAEASLFSTHYHCDAVAAARSTVAVYDKARFLAAARTDPAVFEDVARTLVRQVQALRTRLELRNVRAARERVLQLLRLRAGPDGRTVAVDGPWQELAFELGLTREALYRALAGLERDGVIAREADQVVLLGPPAA